MDSEPIYDEEIDRSNIVICIGQDEEETEAEVWQTSLYDALIKKERAKAVELLSVYNQVCNAPDIARFCDDNGRTFLMHAVCSKSFKIVRMLLRLIDKKRINNYVSLKDAQGYTALDYAATLRCMRILYALAPYVCQDIRDEAIKCLSDGDYKKMVHVNRRNMIFCLSKLSEQDPSDDEDDLPHDSLGIKINKT